VLGIAVLILILILVLKLQTVLNNNKTEFVKHGISEKNYTFLNISLWLYLVLFLILGFPINPLIYLLYPLQILILFIVPGIVYGRKAGNVL